MIGKQLHFSQPGIYQADNSMWQIYNVSEQVGTSQQSRVGTTATAMVM
jgi:hypothetical protein